MKLLQAFVDVISSQGWLRPALAAMELSQMVVQALWDKDSALLQIPHFNAEVVGRLRSARPPVESVFDVLEMEDSMRDELLQFSQEQMSDVAVFCNAYPNIELAFETDIEGNVTAGDSVNVVVNLQREVDEDEDDANIGKVLCPRYPFDKTEGWWLVVGDTNANTLLSIKRISLGKTAKVKLEFTAPEQPGDYNLSLYFISDSYLGCDQEYPIQFSVC